MRTEILRATAHAVFRGRAFHEREVAKTAKDLTGKRILELGSGKAVNGEQAYSMKKLFDRSNDFRQTDVNPAFGHPVVDVTEMTFEDEFDVVLCLNVLEHVFDFQRGFENVHRAVKPGGVALIGVPAFYPLHDEPHDYWRFTEHSLRRLLSPYRSVKLSNTGPRQYPFSYFAQATK